jgi:flagellar capping protein FliD
VLLGRPTEEIDASQKAAQNAHFYRFSLRAVKSEQDVQFGATESTSLKTRVELADLIACATVLVDAKSSSIKERAFGVSVSSSGGRGGKAVQLSPKYTKRRDYSSVIVRNRQCRPDRFNLHQLSTDLSLRRPCWSRHIGQFQQ